MFSHKPIIHNFTGDYSYPIGDFLSGFSDNPDNPCDYELECQKMVIRGMKYFDKNPYLHEEITKKEKFLSDISDPIFKDLINYMIEGREGQTGLMVSHAVSHAYIAYKLGWKDYIKLLLSR